MVDRVRPRGCSSARGHQPLDVLVRPDADAGAGALNWERLYKGLSGQGGVDPAEEARAEAGLRVAVQVLDQHLATRQWICGEALSLADFAIAATLGEQQRRATRWPTSPTCSVGCDRCRRCPPGARPYPDPQPSHGAGLA